MDKEKRKEMHKQLKNENKFQAELIKKIKTRFPGSFVLKNDANYIQGIPDLLVLYKDRWAALECKKSSDATLRPNQAYYISKFDDMSFSRLIYPENEEEVLDELQRSFEP